MNILLSNAHTSLRKENFFMVKMKKILVTAMMAVFVIVVTACGRNDTAKKNSTAATTAKQTTEYETTVYETTAYDTTVPATDVPRESGGVLQDMVDGVENGIDRGMENMDRSVNNMERGTDHMVDGTLYENMNGATSGET